MVPFKAGAFLASFHENAWCIGKKPPAGEFIRPLNSVKVRAGEGESSKGVMVRMRPIDGSLSSSNI
jgi:hypothetical protein